MHVAQAHGEVSAPHHVLLVGLGAVRVFDVRFKRASGAKFLADVSLRQRIRYLGWSFSDASPDEWLENHSLTISTQRYWPAIVPQDNTDATNSEAASRC